MTASTVSTAELDRLTGVWDVDPAHSSLSFATRHAMVATVRGSFREFSGVLELDGAEPTRSRAEVTIDAASIDTGNEQRDEHLRGGDFLDVAAHPALTFASRRVEPGDGAGTFVMYGDLTIKGVSREVPLALEFEGDATDPFGNQRAGFQGTTTISRKDWGLTWNVALEAGGFLVGDKVKLTLDVSAVRRAS